MDLVSNLQVHDLALYLRAQKTLVLADIHLGYENYIQQGGYLVPWFQYKQIKTRLTKILEKTKPKKIIINGDLKHEFGKIPQQEWDEVKGLITFLKTYTEDIILIKGNHDNTLGPIARYKKVKLEPDGLLLANYFITHGHKIFPIPKTADTIIIGHEHPAITLSDGATTETCKCFLKGKYNGKTLIVQPSFCLAADGSDILLNKKLSPFLQQDLDDFEVFLAADKVRYFGRIKELSEA